MTTRTRDRVVLHLVRGMRVGGLERVVLSLVDGLTGHGFCCHIGCLICKGEWLERAQVEETWCGDLEGRGGRGRVGGGAAGTELGARGEDRARRRGDRGGLQTRAGTGGLLTVAASPKRRVELDENSVCRRPVMASHSQIPRQSVSSAAHSGVHSILLPGQGNKSIYVTASVT